MQRAAGVLEGNAILEKGHPMNRTTDTSDTSVELARRRGDGLEITLLWHRQDNRLEVVVADDRSGASFALATGNGREALDVFYHPFAYAAARGIAHPKLSGRDVAAGAATPAS